MLSFSCASWPSGCLLWRNIYLGLLSIFWLGCLIFLLLSCLSCSYILEIKPCWSVCFFILFMVFFAVPNLISLIRFHLFIVAFISVALEDWPKKTLVRFMSENVLPMIPTRSFMVSCLIFVFKPFRVQQVVLGKLDNCL